MMGHSRTKNIGGLCLRGAKRIEMSQTGTDPLRMEELEI